MYTQTAVSTYLNVSLHTHTCIYIPTIHSRTSYAWHKSSTSGLPGHCLSVPMTLNIFLWLWEIWLPFSKDHSLLNFNLIWSSLILQSQLGFWAPTSQYAIHISFMIFEEISKCLLAYCLPPWHWKSPSDDLLTVMRCASVSRINEWQK